jgi:RHS repeat-associated protein
MMLMEGNTTAAINTNDYKYNGKELNTDLGLNLSDYGARWYDAALGRWWSVDPLAVLEYSHSVYAYVTNNPLIFTDPSGMSKAGFGCDPDPQDIINYEHNNPWPWVNDEGKNWSKHIQEKIKSAISENEDDLRWSLLYREDLIEYARYCGFGEDQIKNDREIGELLEAIFNRWFIENKPKDYLYFKVKWNKVKQTGGKRNTVPDFIADYQYFRLVPYTLKVTGRRVREGVFYEVKAANNETTISLSSYEYQPQGHIDNLARKHAAVIRLARSPIGRMYITRPFPQLIFVTTGGVKLSEAMILDGRKKGIIVTQAIAQYRIENGTWYFNFENINGQ